MKKMHTSVFEDIVQLVIWCFEVLAAILQGF